MRALLLLLPEPIAGTEGSPGPVPPPPSDLNDVVLATGNPADWDTCHRVLVPGKIRMNRSNEESPML